MCPISDFKKGQHRLVLHFLMVTVLLLPASLKAQSKGGGNTPLAVTTLQGFSFGSFFRMGSGGTVSISNTGTRSVTNSIILADLGNMYFPARFEVEGAKNSVVNILNGSDVNLSGSNGGSIRLHLESASTGSSFTLAKKSTPPKSTYYEQISIGGTLSVGSVLESPDGVYNGNFSVTFIQQ